MNAANDTLTNSFPAFLSFRSRIHTHLRMRLCLTLTQSFFHLVDTADLEFHIQFSSGCLTEWYTSLNVLRGDINYGNKLW